MTSIQDSTVTLDRTLTLLEYGSCRDPVQADLLFQLRESLKRYLSKGWLKLSVDEQGKASIRACDHVGLLPFPVEGQSRLLMIAPKGCQQNEELGLRRFLELLVLSEGQSPLEELPGWEGRWGPHRFLLFLGYYYAKLLTELCQRDFRSYYRAEEDELRGFVRGRLNVPAYARLAVQGKPHILPCRWDDFTVDNWDNRILWGAARRLRAVAAALDPEAARLVWQPFQRLLSWFSPVVEVPITSMDFHRSRLGRTSGYYRRSLAWARLLLEGSDLPAEGGDVPPLVLNAPKIFEKFAEAAVREALPDASWHPLFQTPWPFLTGPQVQTHKPDIFLSGRQGISAVGDTKYKEVLERAGNADLGNPEKVRLSIEAPDWNQLYVYMRMKHAALGFLVVPFWNKDGEPVYWETGFRFAIGPLDGEAPVRLAVLGLNLLKPLTQVKQEAAKTLRSWLSMQAG